MAQRSKKDPNPKSVTDPERPESWLFLLSEGDVTFGVLRASYKDRSNSALEFGMRKLQPVPPSEFDPDVITAERADVILPREAEDQFTSPIAFLRACDEMKVDPGIIVYLTVPTPDADRLHQAWETGRGFAKILAEERGIATLLIQHVPGRVSCANDPHLHLLICPRTSSKLGLRYGGLDRELLHDSGARILSDRWEEFVDAER